MEKRNEEIRELYDEAIASSLEHLDTLPKDSKEYTQCVDNVTKMYRVRMEQTKADSEHDEAYKKLIEETEKRQSEIQFREQQMKQQHKEFLMKLGADVATNVVKVGTFVIVGKWSAVLESGGVIASSTAKNLVRSVQKFVDFNKY